MADTGQEEAGQKRKILRDVYLFSGVPEADLKALADLAVSKAFARQATIFWEGREAQGFYLLSRGSVKLVKSSPEGKEYIIRLVGPEDLCRGRGLQRRLLPGHRHGSGGLSNPVLP